MRKEFYQGSIRFLNSHFNWLKGDLVTQIPLALAACIEDANVHRSILLFASFIHFFYFYSAISQGVLGFWGFGEIGRAHV